jgi:hypothetical protein
VISDTETPAETPTTEVPTWENSGIAGAKESLMAIESPKPRAGSRFLDAFLQSPFAGLAPWIVMSLLSGPGRFEESVATALGLSILFLFLSHRRGGTLKPLEVFDILYFGCLAAIGLFASDDLITWLEKWSGEMSSLALVAFAFGSLLLRNPFTLPYAKETTPEEYWTSPLFLKVNQLITLVWALSFTVSAAAGLYGDLVLDQPDNFWTGWIIPIGALLFALSFTEWYPDVASAQAPREPGEPEEVAPPLVKLFDFLPPFVVGVGIAMLVTDNDPDWLGITLIVVGALGTAALRRADAQSRSSSAA